MHPFHLQEAVDSIPQARVAICLSVGHVNVDNLVWKNLVLVPFTLLKPSKRNGKYIITQWHTPGRKFRK